MTKYITLDGNKYVVSPQFAAAVERVLGTLEFHIPDTKAAVQALMLASNDRLLTRVVPQHGKETGISEVERLEYLTHVLNVANAIRVVGAHHDPVKEWGFDGWDAVHGNRLKKHCGCEKHGEACAVQPREDCDKPYGCEHHFVFDHHSATNHFGHNRVSEERKHHETAHYPCKAHG
jgi:hypothetical protein